MDPTIAHTESNWAAGNITYLYYFSTSNPAPKRGLFVPRVMNEMMEHVCDAWLMSCWF